MDKDEKNIKAIVEAGEVKVYSRDFFVKAGKRRWKGISKEERSENSRKLAFIKWGKKKNGQ